MKKTLLMLTVALGVFALAGSAYAVPTINGFEGAGEWANDAGGGTPYPYFLEVNDINEMLGNNPDGNIPDAYDIKRVVVLQELTTEGVADANDGVYILIETYLPPSLVDLDGIGSSGARIEFSGDFNSDGTQDIVMTHGVPDFSGSNGSGQFVSVFNTGTFLPGPVGPFALPAANWSIANANKTGTACNTAADATCLGAGDIHLVLEYFIPTGFVGTPPLNFPTSFSGSIVYENSGAAADDFVIGTLIPEPSSMMLLGAGLVGLLGFKRFRSKK